LDDVLDLTIEDILERRFQTIIFRKGLAKTVQQARQLITHGHIMIADQRVTIPGYLVTKPQETQITYTSKSALANPDHPLRQTIAVAPSTEPRAERPEREEDR